MIAVGENFPDKRTADRAKTEGVGLLTVETLCELLTLTDAGHIGAADLRTVFAKTGNIAPNAPAKAASASKRVSSIATAMLSALATEAAGNDDETKGELSSSEIYVLLRGQSDTPSMTDIQTILELLSGPLVRDVVSNAGKVRAVRTRAHRRRPPAKPGHGTVRSDEHLTPSDDLPAHWTAPPIRMAQPDSEVDEEDARAE